MNSLYYLTKRIIWNFLVKRKAQSVGHELRVNRFSSVTSKTILGDNVNFNGIKVIGGGNVRIGNNFHSGSGCRIMTTIHNYDRGTKIPYDETVIHKNVIIEDNVWLGIDVTILPGVTVGEGAIIQACSVVTSDVAPCAIAGGHPAKIFKYRDRDHYERLKSEGRFY